MTVILNCISPALRPQAVVLADDVLLVLAMFCLSMGIQIATDPPDWGNTLQPVYDALSDYAKDQIRGIAVLGTGLYCYVYNCNVDVYSSITQEIYNYFNTNSVITDAGSIVPDSSDGRIGFTSGTSFRMYYPSNTKYVNYYLPSGRFLVNAILDKSLFPQNNIVRTSQAYNGLMLVNDDGFGWVSLTHLSANNFYGNYISPQHYSDYPFYDCFHFSSGWNSSTLDTTNTNLYSNENTFFFDSYGNIYRYYFDSSGHYFRDINNGSKYNDLTFPDRTRLVYWFYNSCGFVVPNASADPVSAPVVNLGVDFDAQLASDTRAANITAANDSATQTLPLVIPDSIPNAVILNDSPALVTDPVLAAEAVPIYPAELPEIENPPALWQTKFPFCIPFDLSRIISDLKAPPSVPVFHILVIPSHSFGLDNDDIYFDFDFSPYSDLVSILRFFISLSFVVFLILITRNIIKG